MHTPRMTQATQRVLRELLAHPGAEKYGLEICKAVGLASGTVHPLLCKFEALGWLVSRIEDIGPLAVGRPRRRYFRLTIYGVARDHEALARTVTGRRSPRPR